MANDIRVNLKAVDKFSSTVDRVTKKFPKLNRKVRESNLVFKKLDRTTRGLRNSLARVGKSMRSTGKSMSLGLTAPIGLMGAKIISTSIDFEKSMNKVRALTGATGKDFQKMEKLARELGSTTQFTATEAGDAMAFLGMAGFDTNQILKATPALLDLSASSGMDLARSADVASNIMGAFQIEADKTGRVADILAKTTASSNTNMEQLAEAMKFVAPVAKDFGMTLEETSTSIGLLGNVGIQGTLAGTSLRKALLGLSAPAGEARTVMKELGVTVTDSSGNLRAFPEIMKDFAVSLNELPKGTQLKALNAVFGKTGISGASALLKQLLPQVNKETGKLEVGFDKLGDKIKNADGSARKMADTMMKGLPGAVTRLSSAFEGLLLGLGIEGGLNGLFASLINDKLIPLIGWLDQLSPAMKKWGLIIIGVVGALGPLIFALGILAPGLNVLVGIIGFAMPILGAFAGMLGAISLPMLAIGGAIGVVVAGIARLIFKWKELKQAFSSGRGFIDTVKKLGSTFFNIGGGATNKRTNNKRRQSDTKHG
jgi:TP901 family phage tail tape measure protein